MKRKKKSKNTQRDFSGGPLVKTRSFQRRECGFDLWVSSRILCGEVKIGYKAMETTGNINNETGPGTNGCTGQCWFKKFCKEDKSLEDGEHSGQPLEVDRDQLRAIMEADPGPTIREVAQELNIDCSVVTWYLKQTEKVKKLNKWVPHELTTNQKKLSFWSVIIAYSVQQQWTISQSDCDSEFYTTTDDQLSSWMEKKLQSSPQSQTCTKRGVTVTVGWSDPLQLSESRRNHYIWEVCSANWWDALKTARPVVGNGPQKGPNSSRQHSTACHTTNASEVERIGLQSFAIFTWPLTNWPPLLQASQQFFAGKTLPQLAGCRKCFPRICWILKHRFLCYRNKQTYCLLAKMCWL